MTELLEAEIPASLRRIEYAIQTTEIEKQRPCVLFRPSIKQDGNAFIALLGEDLQTGVVGTGATPAEAMNAFDQAWYAKAVTPETSTTK